VVAASCCHDAQLARVVVCVLAVLLVLDVLAPDDAVDEVADVDVLGTVVGVAAVAAVTDVPATVALTAATFGLATVEVTPLCCTANAPPAPRNSSVLNAPVMRRAPRAGWALRRRGVVRG